MAAILFLGLVACAGDPISAAESCADLEVAWQEALSDPSLTGDEVNEVNDQAIKRLAGLMVEADELENPIQQEACSSLLVELAMFAGAVDPTFETCPDGSLAVIGECP